MASTPMRLHAKLLFYGLDGGTWSDPPALPAGAASPTAAKAPPRRSDSGSGMRGDCGWAESQGYGAAVYLPPGGAQAWDWDGSNLGGQGAALASIKALWGGNGGDASTDEGSEPKGSESDSMPDTSEGYANSSLTSSPAGSQQMPLGGTSPLGNASALPFSMQRPSVPLQSHAGVSLATVQPDAATVYASYPLTESYLGAHSFGGVEPSACGLEAAYPEAGARYHAYEALATPTLATTGFTGPNPEAAAGQVPPNAQPGADGVPSIGSYAHLTGQCSRCCFHPKGRCANGYSCQFCHFDHDKRPRNGKKKRYRRHSDDAGEDQMD